MYSEAEEDGATGLAFSLVKAWVAEMARMAGFGVAGTVTGCTFAIVISGDGVTGIALVVGRASTFRNAVDGWGVEVGTDAIHTIREPLVRCTVDVRPRKF